MWARFILIVVNYLMNPILFMGTTYVPLILMSCVPTGPNLLCTNKIEYNIMMATVTVILQEFVKAELSRNTFIKINMK